MDAKYPSDAQGRRGLAAYVAHAKELLAESAADKNPFEGYAVEVPDGDGSNPDPNPHPSPSPSPSPNPNPNPNPNRDPNPNPNPEQVPEGERMAIGSDAFREDERRGMAVAQDTVFVLVAGNLSPNPHPKP